MLKCILSCKFSLFLSYIKNAFQFKPRMGLHYTLDNNDGWTASAEATLTSTLIAYTLVSIYTQHTIQPQLPPTQANRGGYENDFDEASSRLHLLMWDARRVLSDAAVVRWTSLSVVITTPIWIFFREVPLRIYSIIFLNSMNSTRISSSQRLITTLATWGRWSSPISGTTTTTRRR